MNCDTFDDMRSLTTDEIAKGLAEFVLTLLAEEFDGTNPPIFFESELWLYPIYNYQVMT